MNKILETLKGLFGKLPFKNLMEKIPTETRNKIPLLNTLIPLSNYIVSGLILLTLILIISGSGGDNINFEKTTYWIDKSRDYIITLWDKGDFILVTSSRFTGKWEVSGNKLTLTYDDDNSTEEFTIKNNTIVNSQGNVYKRDIDWERELARREAQPVARNTTQTSGGGSSQQQNPVITRIELQSDGYGYRVYDNYGRNSSTNTTGHASNQSQSSSVKYRGNTFVVTIISKLGGGHKNVEKWEIYNQSNGLLGLRRVASGNYDMEP